MAHTTKPTRKKAATTKSSGIQRRQDSWMIGLFTLLSFVFFAMVVWRYK